MRPSDRQTRQRDKNSTRFRPKSMRQHLDAGRVIPLHTCPELGDYGSAAPRVARAVGAVTGRARSGGGPLWGGVARSGGSCDGGGRASAGGRAAPAIGGSRLPSSHYDRGAGPGRLSRQRPDPPHDTLGPGSPANCDGVRERTVSVPSGFSVGLCSGCSAADVTTLVARTARQDPGGLPCSESRAGVAQLAEQPSCNGCNEPELTCGQTRMTDENWRAFAVAQNSLRQSRQSGCRGRGRSECSLRDARAAHGACSRGVRRNRAVSSWASSSRAA